MLMRFGVGAVGAIHVYFAYAEMFDWTDTAGKLLGYSVEQAAMTAVLGFNQGAYNLFFAAGLLVAAAGLMAKAPARVLAIFCLASLSAAGLVGLITVEHWLFLIQLVPAAGMLAFILLKREEW